MNLKVVDEPKKIPVGSDTKRFGATGAPSGSETFGTVEASSSTPMSRGLGTGFLGGALGDDRKNSSSWMSRGLGFNFFDPVLGDLLPRRG